MIALQGTRFQRLLNGLSEDLARFNLANSPYSGSEIPYLLGEHDPALFFHAFLG